MTTVKSLVNSKVGLTNQVTPPLCGWSVLFYNCRGTLLHTQGGLGLGHGGHLGNMTKHLLLVLCLSYAVF